MENTNLSDLSSSLRQSWPSDSNMKKSLEKEMLEDPNAVCGLLRKASMLCKPGGQVDPKHKSLIKGMVLMNNKPMMEALESSNPGEKINKYLDLLSLEDPFSNEVDESDRVILVNNWKESMKELGRKMSAGSLDLNSLSVQELEKIQQGLGSKRSRPQSMATMTSFRDINRLRTVRESTHEDDEIVEPFDESSLQSSKALSKSSNDRRTSTSSVSSELASVFGGLSTSKNSLNTSMDTFAQQQRLLECEQLLKEQERLIHDLRREQADPLLKLLQLRQDSNSYGMSSFPPCIFPNKMGDMNSMLNVNPLGLFSNSELFPCKPIPFLHGTLNPSPINSTLHQNAPDLKNLIAARDVEKETKKKERQFVRREKKVLVNVSEGWFSTPCTMKLVYYCLRMKMFVNLRIEQLFYQKLLIL